VICFVLTVSLAGLRAQIGGIGNFGSFGDVPVEITADGNTRFEEGVAVAEDNVQIHYKEYSIYCDYAEYNPETRDVLLVGNIRVYTPKEVLTGQRALFNLESKQMRALEFSGSHYPMLFHAFNFRAMSQSEFRVRDGVLTTDDNSKPDFHVKSRSMRIYTDSRAVFSNSTVYIGRTPIFWFPYLFANINNTGFAFLPGYDSRWGAYLLTAYSFPLVTGVDATVRADWRSEFGPSLGFDAKMEYGKNDRSYGNLRTDYVFETKDVTTVEAPGEPTETRTTNRYRVSFQQRLFLTDDIYATADINLLSDVDFLEDFYPGEFRIDPQPDNVLSLTKWDEAYTLNLIARWQMNDFQDVTERLPEFVADFKQMQFFGLPVNYDGETGVANLRRTFSNNPSADETEYPDYGAVRFDTFHQWSLPKTYFGWLSVIPKVGIRGTYYSQSGTFLTQSGGDTAIDPVTGLPTVINPSFNSTPLNNPSPTLQNKGAVFRVVANYGFEASTKFSRAFEKVQNRWLGLDGLRHVVQPYVNYSGVYNFGPSPSDIYQFDRVVESTQLLPLNFPQFTAVDSIDTWNIVRLGVRQRLQTRRDNRTFQWFSLDTFMDVNLDNPYSDGPVSNVFNVIGFRPVPWAGLTVVSQLPVTEEGFTEVNTSLSFMPTRDWSLSIGHRYIDGNSFFADDSQLNFFTYWRMNDHWAFSLYEQYEFVSKVFQYQRYMVHRDLSSWIASVGAEVRDNDGGDREIGLLLVMTLKDAPRVTLPLAFSQSTSPIAPSGD
ncbi:MAG: LPS assembly protein LptD, partial [Candidatus Methylomirabilota bacterium]